MRQTQWVGIICSPGWDRVNAFENLGKAAAFLALPLFTPLSIFQAGAHQFYANILAFTLLSKKWLPGYIYIFKKIVTTRWTVFLHWKKTSRPPFSTKNIFIIIKKTVLFVMKKTHVPPFIAYVSAFKELRIFSFSVNNMTEKSQSFLGF